MCGLWNAVWGGVKKAAGAAGKWLINQEGVRNAVSKGLGVAASMIPVIGPKAAPLVERVVSKGLNKLNSYVNDVPEGNVKSSLKAAIPKVVSQNKVNQYRSANAVSSAGEGTVYGQATHPIWREKRNFGDGITTAVAKVPKIGRRYKRVKRRVKH